MVLIELTRRHKVLAKILGLHYVAQLSMWEVKIEMLT